MPETYTSLTFQKISVFGPQGSGKGTQAEILSKRINVPWISTGNIYRQNIKEGTDLGKLAAQCINKGNLAPDELTNQLMQRRLGETDAKKGFILDGYPRNKIQMDALDEMVSLELALEIWISDQEAISRISGRRVCNCGMTYHLNFNPPSKSGLCNLCGGELVQRDDDKEEAIKKRLAIYHKQTEPLLQIYLKRGILIHINGEKPILEVTQEIFQKLSKKEFTKE